VTRIAIGIEYQGAAFEGWQKQSHTSNTLQSVIEAAISKVANETIHTTCAGRTDAGVHATAQTIHFDCEQPRSMTAWRRGVDSCLPKDIRIIWAQAVPDEFHARFSATLRTYVYFIDNRTTHSPFLKDLVTWYGQPLCDKLMQQGANHLIGEHDFSAFRSSRCQSKTPRRHIHSLTVTREGHLIKMTVKANAFLHHMIRNIIGVLKPIGEGKQPPEWAKTVLDSKDRSIGYVTAHPNGLYLSGIKYPDEYNIPTARPFSLTVD
jgi:tRNA pseudouridine38-40 synthase